jgi:hypothetical protein
VYEDVYDRRPTLSELESALRDLDCAEALALLSQISADLRLSKREKEPAGKLQQELAGSLLDDETVDRLRNVSAVCTWRTGRSSIRHRFSMS